MNEVRAYQTLLWQQNPIQLLSQFNSRTLTFDQPSEDDVGEIRNLKPGPYTFRNPILKGKDDLNNIDVDDGFSHSSSASVANIDVCKRTLYKPRLPPPMVNSKKHSNSILSTWPHCRATLVMLEIFTISKYLPAKSISLSHLLLVTRDVAGKQEPKMTLLTQNLIRPPISRPTFRLSSR